MASTVEEIKLIIPLTTYRKIMAYITLCETEVSGFAEIEYNVERNCFVAGEVYLLEQEATGAHVEMDEEAVAKFNMERIKAGADQLPRIWWHSHVDMGAFFSVTDEDTSKQLQNETFNVSLVGNKRGEFKAKCYVAQSIPMLATREYIEVDPLPIKIELEYERIPDSFRKEVEKKVKKKVFTPSTPVQRSLYSGKQAFGGKIAKALSLPKDPTAAINRIEQLELERQWSYELDDWKWVDPKTGQIWVDQWAVVPRFFNTKVDAEEIKRLASPDVNEMLENMENGRDKTEEELWDDPEDDRKN